MARIFISYRRSDSADATGRIYDQLCLRFGRRKVFKDVDSIPVGVDFRRRIEREIKKCHAVLAVIGRHWLDAITPDGRRRIDDPQDTVRIELEIALSSKVKVIPVLVQEAKMPEEGDLPHTLKPLSGLHAAAVRSGRDFHTDLERLSRAISPARRLRPLLWVAVCAAALTAAAVLYNHWLPRVRRPSPQSSIQPESSTQAEPGSGPPQGQVVAPAADPALARLLQLRSRDGKRPLLETLYEMEFDLNSLIHVKILENLLAQIKSPAREYGVALDIDRLQLVHRQAPLVCRDLVDLEQVLQNQLDIYLRGKELIARLFGLSSKATYSNDPLLRQIVADYEGKIRTPFRTMGVRLDLKTGKRVEMALVLRTVDEVIDVIGAMLEVTIKLGVPPGPSDYDVSHIGLDFVPTAGYNIL